MSHPKPTTIDGKLYKSRADAAKQLGISQRRIRYAVFENNSSFPCLASIAKFKKICKICDHEKTMTSTQKYCTDCRNRWGYDLSNSVSVKQRKYLEGRGKQILSHAKTRYKAKRWELGLNLICENSDGCHGFICHHAHKKFKSKEQLDVNHKDGNKFNNDPANLELICKCCHALVTRNENHYGPNKYKKGKKHNGSE